jgi:hypothetical protein
MYKKLANFARFQPRRGPPRLDQAVPTNDNLPIAARLGKPRRIRAPQPACHWSLDQGGTRLICRWEIAPQTQTASENLHGSGTNHGVARKRSGFPTDARKLTGRT